MGDLLLVPVDVEICLHTSSTAKPSDIRDHAQGIIERAYRGKAYAPGLVTALLVSSGDALLARHVKSARICEIVNPVAVAGASDDDGSENYNPSVSAIVPLRASSVYLHSVSFWSALLRLFVFQLNEDGPSSESSAEAGAGEGGGGGGGEADVLTQYTQWNLPSNEFEGMWEALLYDDDDEEEEGVVGGAGTGTMVVDGTAAGAVAEDTVAGACTSGKRPREPEPPSSSPKRAKRVDEGEAGGAGGLEGSRLKPALLSYAASALAFSDAGVESSLIAWNHVVLLHGPPGTGKTSLCKALAHKLSIRLSARYPTAQLIEINAHSLFSRWFSESGKLVHRLFGHIREMTEDEDCLVVLLIDEVESLTSARKAAVSGSEPSDAVRVVNAVLTAIDSFRTRKNVLLLTTSNVSEAIDVAFVDRADIKARVGPPGAKARYDIMASCVGELIRVGIVKLGDGTGSGAGAAAAPAPPVMRLADGVTASALAKPGPWSCSTEGVDVATTCMVWQAARAAAGFSGRTLRKLPLQAHAMFLRHTPGTPASGVEFGRALLKAVRAERAARADFADLG